MDNTQQLPAIEVGKLTLNELAQVIHNHNRAKGFYNEYDKTMEVLNAVDPKLADAYCKTFTAQRIALMHSELSESLEGSRKDLMDDHLPDLKSEEVELADCIIRILDTAGWKGIDILQAVERKLAYNQGRAYLHGKKF